MLRTLPESRKSKWHDSLNHVIHAYNCTRQDSTGYSPYFLLFGRNAGLSIYFLLTDDSHIQTKRHGKEIEKWKESTKEAHKLAAKHSQEMKARNTKRRNKVIYIPLDVGDRVLIKNLNEKGGPG